LKNVDAKSSQRHADAIQSKWFEWNNQSERHWIFSDFIERERNNILKEFAFGASLPTSPDDPRVLSYDDNEEDGTQLFREAVYWWRDQLEGIEGQL
jgi:hypothetical protein